jgi:hypothetical protein
MQTNAGLSTSGPAAALREVHLPLRCTYSMNRLCQRDSTVRVSYLAGSNRCVEWPSPCWQHWQDAGVIFYSELRCWDFCGRLRTNTFTRLRCSNAAFGNRLECEHSIVLQNGAETAATAAPQSEFLLLRSGAKLPLVGFGTYKVDKADSVRYAIFLFHADQAVSCHHTHVTAVV